MSKKIIIILTVVLILAIAIFIGINWYTQEEKNQLGTNDNLIDFVDYYKSLEKFCDNAGSKSCCISSVDRMRKGGYKLSPENGCGEEYNGNMLKCIDSLKWCEPKEKLTCGIGFSFQPCPEGYSCKLNTPNCEDCQGKCVSNK